MTAELATSAPAKINLSLFVGPNRADGRHEVVTVMDSLTIADDLRLRIGPDGLRADEVRCPGVEGPNLAAAALAAFRARTGWDGPPVRLDIVKRIPVAGGMAGGSADAAGALRLAARAAGIDDVALLEEIAAELGSDVPSQIAGGPVLATGAGDRLERLAPRAPYSVLVLALDAALPAGAVYAEADRLGLPRDAAALAAARDRVRAGLEGGGLGPVHNDLQDAARSLCPAIDDALAAAGRAGADHAVVSGSGPTVVALFTGAGHRERALRGERLLAAEGRRPAPRLAEPVGPAR
jgi:4-diphosphocytidyl-2-C-methyl-D-erythritol kinase